MVSSIAFCTRHIWQINVGHCVLGKCFSSWCKMRFRSSLLMRDGNTRVFFSVVPSLRLTILISHSIVYFKHPLEYFKALETHMVFTSTNEQSSALPSVLGLPLDQAAISIRAAATIAIMPPHPSPSLAPLPSGVPPPPSLGSVVVPCREIKKRGCSGLF